MAAAETPSRDDKLNTLFDELKRTGNPATASNIAERINRIFSESGSDTVDLLMQRATKAMKAGKHMLALDLLDEVVMLAPAYAEGWNRRATLHFTMKNHAKSMSDIQRVLQLEPRHFGALAGMAAILMSRNRKRDAMDVYLRTLEIYPTQRNAQDAVGRIAEEIAGEKI